MGILDSMQDALSEAAKAGEQIEQLMNDDAVAGKASWKDVRSPGSRSTHKFQKISPTRIEFKPDYPALIFPTIFMLVITGGMVSSASKLQEFPPMLLYVLPIIALVIVVATVNKIYRGTIPVVFDLTAGYYWKSRRQPDHADVSESKTACRLSDIHALQLIRVSSTSGSSSGRSTIGYQLNLVKKDGSRLNVTNGNQSTVELNAEELSKFLSIPVWNFSTHSVL